MDTCEGYEVTAIWFSGYDNYHSWYSDADGFFGDDGWGYVREAGLDFPLVFPEMLIDGKGRVRVPLARAIAEAQRGIDESLSLLTSEQRERYLGEKECVTMALYPSGDVHMVTMDGGVLRLWDEVPVREAFERYVHDDPCFSANLPGVEQEIEAGNVENFNELMALVWCARLCLGDVDPSIHELWGRLRPLLREGRILASDVVATCCDTPMLGHRDRVGECLALRRLIGEKGWGARFAQDAVELMTLLHYLAGDSGYDLGEELVPCGDVIAEVFEAQSRVPGECGVLDRLTGMAFGVGNDWGMHWGNDLYERDTARYVDGVHEVIRALHAGDAEEVWQGLERVYRL